MNRFLLILLCQISANCYSAAVNFDGNGGVIYKFDGGDLFCGIGELTPGHKLRINNGNNKWIVLCRKTRLDVNHASGLADIKLRFSGIWDGPIYLQNNLNPTMFNLRLHEIGTSGVDDQIYHIKLDSVSGSKKLHYADHNKIFLTKNFEDAEFSSPYFSIKESSQYTIYIEDVDYRVEDLYLEEMNVHTFPIIE